MIGAAHAKLNLALVVGARRADGMHELLTVFQRLDLADTISVEPADETTIEGFAEDTLVGAALGSLDAPHGWRAVIDKRIPVAGGLGGGSSDAATALRLGNAQLEDPLDEQRLHELAASLGSDVPFFLRSGPQLGSGVGATLEPVEIPQDFVVCLLLPHGASKASTRAVYEAFDARGGGKGFAERAMTLRDAVGPRSRSARPRRAAVERPRELRPRRDVAGSGGVPCGCERRRADGVRALRRSRGGRASLRCGGADRLVLGRQPRLVA